MAYPKNKVIDGDYKNATVEVILGEVSISGGPSGRLFLSRDTVASCEINMDEPPQPTTSGAQYITVQFQDGSKSLLEVDRNLGRAIVANCLSEAKVQCGVTPEKIKSCDPSCRTNCGECPCFRCVLWPKCCYGRIFARRAARRKNITTSMRSE